MEKYLEQIIEIILENVFCEHQEIDEFPHGPKIDDPTYFLEDQNAVIEKCIEAIPTRLIERPEIDTIFIGNKARELFGWSADPRTIKECEDFLCSLFNELAAKINLPVQPELTKEFIEKKARKLHQAVYGSLMKCDFKCHMMIKFREQIRALFEDENVE